MPEKARIKRAKQNKNKRNNQQTTKITEARCTNINSINIEHALQLILVTNNVCTGAVAPFDQHLNPSFYALGTLIATTEELVAILVDTFA
jgi:hypothetical protein